jgi:hypothetical protein
MEVISYHPHPSPTLTLTPTLALALTLTFIFILLTFRYFYPSPFYSSTFLPFGILIFRHFIFGIISVRHFYLRHFICFFFDIFTLRRFSFSLKFRFTEVLLLGNQNVCNIQLLFWN